MASTQVHQTTDSLLGRRSSCRAELPPEYEAADGEYVELNRLASSAATSTETLPEYEASASSSSAAAGLVATRVFQIETHGHPLIALPVPPKPVPLPVYSVLPTGELGPLSYQSLRATRRSGNSLLVRAGHGLGDSPVCSTVYRFGPNRPPKLQLQGDVACDDEFEVRSKGCHTRAQTIRTHLGSFQWRYASRAERKAVGASTLLVLDLIMTLALAGGKQVERRRRVAQLVRNDEFRTEGTRGCTAGNGGRLMMDLSDWADTKGEAQQMEVILVASCITMLKKEVDRRRTHQLIVLTAGASGAS